MKTIFVLGCFLLWSAAAWADDLTRAVQQRLKDRGFYYGDVDGQRGAECSAAIRRYQIRYGLKVNGELNQETLSCLGLSGNNLSPAPATTPRIAVTNQPNGSPRRNPTPDATQRNQPQSN